MEAMDAILSRRSRKEFINRPIEFEKIAEILNAGNHAPSAGNLQNWRFLVITNKKSIAKLPGFCEGQECLNAPIVIIVCSETEEAKNHFGKRAEMYNHQNCAAAIQNMLIAANNYSLGAVWIGLFNEERIKEEFNIPEDITIQGIIPLGYSSEEPHYKRTKELREVVYFNDWGNRTRNLRVEQRDFAPFQERFIMSAQSGIDKIKQKLRKSKE